MTDPKLRFTDVLNAASFFCLGGCTTSGFLEANPSIPMTLLGFGLLFWSVRTICSEGSRHD